MSEKSSNAPPPIVLVKKPGLLSRLAGIPNVIRKQLTGSSMPASAYSSLTMEYPVLIPLRELYSKLLEITNKYELYRVLEEVDSELYGAISSISWMVKGAYQGLGVRPGKELDDKEKELLKECNKFERKWKLPDMFKSIAHNMIRDGDDIWAVKIDEHVGLSEMRPLPIQYVTIVENPDQVGKTNIQVFKPNIYVLNELSGTSADTESVKTWPNTDILHFSINNKCRQIHDVLGRYTFGCWSLSPVEPLRIKLLWKMSLTINDIILRQRLIPRQHHKLNLEEYKPALFAGATFEDRVSAATAAATKHVLNYKTNIATPLKHVDQDLITSSDVEVDYLEPRHVAYIDPNELISQLNASIAAAVGVSSARLSGVSRSTYASELVVASFQTMIAESIADNIKSVILGLVRRSFRHQFGNTYSEDDLMKIDIRIRSLMGFEKGESTRRAAVKASMDIATLDELRDEVGLFDPLTPEERQELMKRIQRGRSGDRRRTIDDVNSDYQRRVEEPAPETIESQRDKKET